MTQRRYWFRAKRYGYGWGMPLTWQGWATMVTFSAVALLAPVVLGEQVGLVVVLVSTVGVLAICYRTGEPPRWRWGRR